VHRLATFESWYAVDGDALIFPGPIKQVVDGAIMSRLIRLPGQGEPGAPVVLPPTERPSLPRSDDADPEGPVTESIESLVADLRGGDEERQKQALRSLARLGPVAAPALPELMKLLASDSLSLGIELRKTLGEIGEPAVEPVRAALSEADSTTRANALSALAWLGPLARPAKREILDAAKDTDEDVRLQAIGALGDLEVHEQEILEVLLLGLDDDSDMIRMQAGQELRRFGEDAAPAVPKLTAALKRALEADDAGLTLTMTGALGAVGRQAKSAAPLLLSLLDHQDADRRVSAASALGSCEYVAAIPKLIERLEAGHEAERFAMIDALSSMGPPGQAGLLRGLGDKSWRVRMLSCSALGKIVPSDAVVTALIGALTDEHERVRTEATTSLSKFGAASAPATSALIALLDPQTDLMARSMAVHALGQIGPGASAATEALEAQAKGAPEAQVRLNAYASLALVDSSRLEETLAAFNSALASEDTEARIFALRLLGRLEEKGAPALPAVVEALNGSNTEVRFWAPLPMMSMGPAAADAVVHLIPFLEGEDARFRAIVAQTLGKIGPAATPALPALERCLNAPHEGLREEARAAIEAIRAG
jgi:HEAT repeat protein